MRKACYFVDSEAVEHGQQASPDVNYGRGGMLVHINHQCPYLSSSFEDDDAFDPLEISVGATRRFFGCWAEPESEGLLSSFSDSLAVRASRFPNTLLLLV